MNRPLTDGGRMASGAGGPIAQRTVWPHRVVLAAPPFDQDLQHPAVLRARRQKGIGPDVMAVRRAAADAGPRPSATTAPAWAVCFAPDPQVTPPAALSFEERLGLLVDTEWTAPSSASSTGDSTRPDCATRRRLKP